MAQDDQWNQLLPKGHLATLVKYIERTELVPQLIRHAMEEHCSSEKIINLMYNLNLTHKYEKLIITENFYYNSISRTAESVQLFSEKKQNKYYNILWLEDVVNKKFTINVKNKNNILTKLT